MAQLNVRLGDHTRDLFDSLADARGVSASELIRDLINQALGRSDSERPRDDTTPASLSAVERRKLSLQHEAMALLTSDKGAEDGGHEAQYHRQMVEVLSAGYTAEYYKTFQMIRPEMTDRECDLVHDILEMFTRLEWSVDKLTDEELASLGEYADHGLKFHGFDFNDSQESRLASYAHFLVKDGRWTDMADRFDAKHERGNSHSPMLVTYRRMLSVWKPLWDKKVKAMGGPQDDHFTADELRDILAAWPYPRG